MAGRKSKEGALAQAAKILGAKGGKIGGRKRTEALTKSQRDKISAKGGKNSAGVPKTGR